MSRLMYFGVLKFRIIDGYKGGDENCQHVSTNEIASRLKFLLSYMTEVVNVLKSSRIFYRDAVCTGSFTKPDISFF